MNTAAVHIRPVRLGTLCRICSTTAQNISIRNSSAAAASETLVYLCKAAKENQGLLFITKQRKDDMLIDEYKYFDQHRKELAEQYPDKWLLIKDRQVLFAMNTLKEIHEVRRERNIDDCLIDFSRKDGKKRILKVRQSYYFSYV